MPAELNFAITVRHGIPEIDPEPKNEIVHKDLPAGGRPMLIAVTTRRLKCDNAACRRRTFTEPIDPPAGRHARTTAPLRRMLELLSLAVAGRAASRLAGMLGIPVCRDTLIRLIRALPDPVTEPVTVLGIDEWAKRKGHSHATLLVDMATRRPIDVLDGCGTATVTAWLRRHPGIEVICRDRAGAFAEAAGAGAPQATQVADRWHLWNNLCRAVEKVVRAHRADLREPLNPGEVVRPLPTGAPPAAAPSGEPGPITAARTRERHAAVHEPTRRGMTVAAIAQRLGLDRKTIRKYRDAATAEELVNGRRSRSRAFEHYVSYLHRRVVHDGEANAARLFAELQAHGFGGSRRTVRRYLEPLRAGLAARVPPPPPPPTVREVSTWITGHPERLAEEIKVTLKAILSRSARLARLSGHVTGFARMLTERTGAAGLKPWLAAVLADDIPQLHSFARGVERDRDAVLNGLTLPHSSGAVEGNVTRIKALKRARYGRAGFDLQRKVILCSPF
ncbi:ISL3 family transposase [Sinosporangium siamense]|uniref:ISL3 family transposase n=1 Tax=Sinosporangium siamense TaxID=1367973 RepID=A0A919VA54_9ACTN|nr:ISL3 family transposase [Sinosporangium siamense]GII96076.1 ISL3 family transposase [Sinosporangium siamense]